MIGVRVLLLLLVIGSATMVFSITVDIDRGHLVYSNYCWWFTSIEIRSALLLHVVYMQVK